MQTFFGLLTYVLYSLSTCVPIEPNVKKIIYRKRVLRTNLKLLTVQKVSKYGVFGGPNIGKYGPEKTPYLDTFTQWLLKEMLHSKSKENSVSKASFLKK